jgi:hypothetical protein
LTGIYLIKSPLYAKHDQDDEDGGIAVNFLHGMLVCGLLKISKGKLKIIALLPELLIIE